MDCTCDLHYIGYICGSCIARIAEDAKIMEDDPCQPSDNDFDEIEDWKGSGKRKMKRIK